MIEYTEPNLDFEWEEANRYPEFAKIGKEAWIELASKGKALTINSAKGINNTDAEDPDSFNSLDPNKQKRALAQLEKGKIEMPIVAVYSDGHKELIGGNTRLTAMMAKDGQAIVWAFNVPDEVAETKMNFQLIDKELSESRLFRSTRRFATLTGKDIANLMYLNNLIMAMLYLDKDFNKTAKQYATATAQYSTYALFRTHATDMYLLAYQICHPDNDNFNIKDPANSKKFLDKLQFSKDKHINFLRRIQRGYVDGSELTTYLFRLETQLSVTDSRYKTWRRSVLDWPRLNDQNRRAFVRRLQNELRVIGGGTGRGSELLISLDAINKPRVKSKPKAVSKPKASVDKYNSKPSISKIEKFWSRKKV